MDVITTTKVVKRSGSSLVLYISKEARLLHLKEGDAVEVQIKIKK